MNRRQKKKNFKKKYGFSQQDYVNIIIPKVKELLRKLVEKIKGMSDEEWEQFKKQLNEEQISIAEKIRGKEKKHADIADQEKMV